MNKTRGRAFQGRPQLSAGSASAHTSAFVSAHLPAIPTAGAHSLPFSPARLARLCPGALGGILTTPPLPLHVGHPRVPPQPSPYTVGGTQVGWSGLKPSLPSVSWWLPNLHVLNFLHEFQNLYMSSSLMRGVASESPEFANHCVQTWTLQPLPGPPSLCWLSVSGTTVHQLHKQKPGGEGGGRGWEGWVASPTQGAWVWERSGWWRTGRPGVLQSMGSQSRTRLSDWTTKPNTWKASLTSSSPMWAISHQTPLPLLSSYSGNLLTSVYAL